MSRYHEREWDDEFPRGSDRRREIAPEYPPFNDTGYRSYDRDASHDPRDAPLPYDGRHPHNGPPRPPSPPEGPGYVDDSQPHSRPRSVPPQQAIIPHEPYPYHARSFSRSPPRYSDDRFRGDLRDRDSKQRYDHRSHHRSPERKPSGPLGEARSAFDRTFSQTSSGLGVGLLGAVVGGLAAHEASHAAIRTRSKKELDEAINDPNSDSYRHPYPGSMRRRSSTSKQDADRTRLVSTVVGALVGGLGANAVEKRFERGRKQVQKEQAAWERRWGHDDDRREHYSDDDELLSDDRRRKRREMLEGGREPRRESPERIDYWGEDDYRHDDRRRPTRRAGDDDGHYRM